MLKIIRLVAFVAALVGLASAPALAQSGPYPAKPVRLIVPYPPGGGNDLLARLIAQKLTQMWGEQVIVENRAGAGATIGTSIVAKSPPDGYTILLSSVASHAISPNLYKKLEYDPIKDFSSITMIAVSPIVLVVNSNLPVKSVSDLVALAQSKPGSLNFGSAGNGSITHLAGEIFKSIAGVDMLHVPYGGGGPSLIAAQANDVQMVFEPAPSALATAAGGKVRALAIARTERLPDHPELPTFKDAGFPDFNVSTWYSLHAPAGTPRPIIDKIQHDVATILKTADMQAHLRQLGSDAGGGTPEELDAFVRKELDTYTSLMKKISVRVD